ncbi:MAG: ATP-dependent helicase [Deltaproteobacteria bacterium]|nr:ATP-dependent helicase [Deltaproteobacteria bacterium]
MMADLSTLNPNQRAAVEWNEGALVVLAGPGSGKTFVLTNRIARILQQSAGSHFRVLGLTFTNKAAREMDERVGALVPAERSRVLLTTFHSFAAEILRQHGKLVGLRPDFLIVPNDPDRLPYLAQAMQETGVPPQIEARGLLNLVDHVLQQGYGHDPRRTSSSATPEWFPALLDAYRRIVLAAGSADFALLVWLAHQVLATRPAVAKQLRSLYRFVCVDEFQDTNFGQYAFLRALVGPKPANLFVVADDDQVIYQWNGASPQRLAAVRDDYDAGVIQLPQTYRCPAEVVALANQLIAHNRSRSADKLPLVTSKVATTPGVVRAYSFRTVDDELAWLAYDIKLTGRSPGDCCVLARSNKLRDAAAAALNATGVKAHVLQRQNDFSTPAFRWLQAILRLAQARQSTAVLGKVCAYWTELGQPELDVTIIEGAAALDADHLRAWLRAARTDANAMVVDVLADALADRLSLRETVDAALAWFKALGLPANVPEFNDEEKVWKSLQAEAGRNVGGIAKLSIHRFLQQLDIESKAPPPPTNAVTCLTVHSAKGLEFPNVYIVGMAEDEFPSFFARREGPDSRQMEEERRNCFVAVTRAQATLTLTVAAYYGGWERVPSRFLAEMGVASVAPPGPST